MSSDQLLYRDITYKIRGACFEVWKAFGGAFKEKIVERSLAHALTKAGLKVETQKQLPVLFDGKIVGTYTPDLIVGGRVLIELKGKPFLTNEDERQFWRYLKASDYRLGMLINFGPDQLTIKRRVYDLARNQSPRKSA